MDRALLHKDKLAEFAAWLDARGIPHRPGRGHWQLLQVRHHNGWQVLYARSHMPEHVTVPEPLTGLVWAFIKERRAERNEVAT